MKPPSENTNKTGSLQNKSKRGTSDRRWTLLFIGDHGRVITLKRFKGIVFLTGLVFVLCVTALAGLYWYSQSITSENENMQSSLDTFQKRIQTLRHEKEILMARLVLAESRVKERSDGSRAIDTPKPWLAQKQKEPSEKDTGQVAVKQKTTPAANPPAKPANEIEAQETTLSVKVDNFNISKISDPNKIKIEFKIKNTSPNSQRVAGHAIVVLKGDDLQPKMWLSVPPMGLVGGKPTGKQRGHTFSINYFMTMRFTTNAPQSPDQFNKAAVYVYTRQGQLLLEQEFGVKIPVIKAKASQPSSAASAAPAQIIVDPKEQNENVPADDQTSETDERPPLY
jgi:hypothetical protein